MKIYIYCYHHLKFLETAKLLVVPEKTMQVTLVTEVVSLTEASPVHMRAEGGAPLVTVTRPRTPGPPASLLTRHTVPGDMVTLQTRATPTLAPTVQAPAPFTAPGPAARPLVAWPTLTRAISLKLEM